jgi:hypothetical protein
MKLSDLKENDQQLDELLPALGAVAGGVARGAAALGGAALARGTTPAAGSAVNQAASGLAGGGMDPAQAAQAVKDRQEQKKVIQQQIQAKQKELDDLRKQLATLG